MQSIPVNWQNGSGYEGGGIGQEEGCHRCDFFGFAETCEWRPPFQPVLNRPGFAGGHGL